MKNRLRLLKLMARILGFRIYKTYEGNPLIVIWEPEVP